MNDSTRSRPRAAWAFAVVATALSANLSEPPDAAAQSASGARPEALFGPGGISGASVAGVGYGTPGTSIQLTPEGLPPGQRVKILIGSLEAGFVVVGETRTDEAGRIALRPQVPDWVQTDRPYAVVVADEAGRPLHHARLFHPTTRDGTLSRSGRVRVHGTCTMLVSDDAPPYLLHDDTGSVQDGMDGVLITGVAEPAGSCGDGIAIRVQHAQVAHAASSSSFVRFSPGPEHLEGFPTIGSVVGAGFGPVGSTVRIALSGLPPQQPMQIIFGGLRDGFEVVAQGVTDNAGNLTLAPEMPEWVSTDRAYTVLVTDLYYKPLGEAGVLHPVSSEGLLTRTGRIISGSGCTLLLADDDRRYALLGNAAELGRLSGEVRVSGRAEAAAGCGNAPAIRVQSAGRIGP